MLGWRSLVSKIHPQLPLNPRESQKLLSLLKSSFRQQLDREHPVVLSESRHATDDHLQSILKNPLFEAEPRKRRLSSDLSNGSQLGRTQELLERPLDYFKAQVIAGTATLDTAEACLSVQFDKLSVPFGPSSKVSVRSSDTGSIILSWLWSSGLAESKAFLQNERFMGLLMPFLVVEGRGDLVWRWLMQLQPRLDHTTSSTYFVRHRYMFFKIIESEAKFGAGVVSSLNLFMQRLSEVRSLPEPFRYITKGLFDRAGIYLCKELAQASESNIAEVGRYDALYQTVDSWSSRAFYHRGLMELNHPQNPIAVSALIYLKGCSPERLDRKHTVQLGLKTAEVLLSKDSQAETAWVFDYLSTHCGEELGISSKTGSSSKDLTHNLTHKETTVKEEEESSLRSLEALEAH